MLDALERHLGLPRGEIKVYVLVEQIEASLPAHGNPRRAGPHFVGFNTGRWDYINSVSDAASWDPAVVNPNIDAITMTYGYMRVYEDRVRRAVNTPDRHGRFALWQGGMEPNIPVGSPAGVQASMARAVAGAEREQREGASGKWVAHWKMVHIVRPVWEKAGEPNQLGRDVPALDLRRRRMPTDCSCIEPGAADDPRRARSDQRRAPVRQCLRPRLSRRRRSSQPISSATTTCCI